MTIFYKQSVLVFFLKFLSGISTFLLYLVFSHFLLPETLGLYELAMTLVMLFTQLMSLGFVQYACGELTRKDLFDIKETIGKINFSYLAVASIFSILLLIILSYFKDDLKYSNIDIILIISVSFLFFYRNIYAGILQHTFKPIKYSLIEALYPATLFFLCSIYLYYFKGSSLSYLMGASLIALVIISFMYYYDTKHSLEVKVYSKKEVLNVISLSYSWFFVAILNWFMYSSDKWLIQYYFDLNNVGIYSQIYKLSSAYNSLIVATISVVSTPYIYRSFRSKSAEYSWGYIKTQALYLALLTTFIILIMFLIGFDFYKVLVGKNYWSGYKYIYPIIINFMLAAITGYFNTIFLYVNKTRYIQVPILLGILLNFVFALIFAPLFSIYGILLSSFLTQIIMLFCSAHYAKKVIFQKNI